MSAGPDCLRQLCVVLVSETLSEQHRRTAGQALENRGFEVFADRPLPDAAFPSWPNSVVREGGRVLIAFNPLIEDQAQTTGEVYVDPATDSAVYHLGAVLGPAASGLRVAVTARQATALCRHVLSPSEMQTLRTQIAARREEMRTDEPVFADLSRFKHRAKVELVEWNGQKAVKKTFRATARAEMAREVAFHEDIAPLSGVPARILARSKNALYFEHIDKHAPGRAVPGLPVPALMPLDSVRQLAEFARLVTGRGWDPVDLTPRDNILIERRSGALRGIDFEFAFCRDAPVDIEDACFLSGIGDAHFSGLPLDAAMRRDPYAGKWRPQTGLSKRSFLHDPAWLQRIKRALVHPIWLILRAPGGLWRRRVYLAERAAILSALAWHEDWDDGAPEVRQKEAGLT